MAVNIVEIATRQPVPASAEELHRAIEETLEAWRGEPVRSGEPRFSYRSRPVEDRGDSLRRIEASVMGCFGRLCSRPYDVVRVEAHAVGDLMVTKRICIEVFDVQTGLPIWETERLYEMLLAAR